MEGSDDDLKGVDLFITEVDDRSPQLRIPDDDGSNKRIFNYIGVIVSICGSAVGFGNMYKFPTIVAKSGGMAFVLLYIFCALLVCIPFGVVEIMMGQLSRGSLIDAGALAGKRSGGYLGAAIIPVLGVLAFYGSIQVNAIKYLVESVKQPWFMNTADYEANAALCQSVVEEASCVAELCAWTGNSCETLSRLDISLNYLNSLARYDTDAIVDVDYVKWSMLVACWFVIFLLGTVGIKQIPIVMNFITVPLLLMIITLVGISCSLPNAGEGIRFYIGGFDASQLVDLDIIRLAMTHAVFSCSLASFVIPELSAMNDIRDPIGRSAFYVVLGDTTIGLLSGFIVYGMTGYIADVEGVTVENVIARFEGNEEGLVYAVYSYGLSLFFEDRGGAAVNFIFFLLYSLMGFTSIFVLATSIIKFVVNTNIFTKSFGRGRLQEAIALGVLIVVISLFSMFNASDFALPILIAYIDQYVTFVMMPFTLFLEGYFIIYDADINYSRSIIGESNHAITKFLAVITPIIIGMVSVWAHDPTTAGITFFCLVVFGSALTHCAILPLLYMNYNKKSYVFNLKHAIGGFPVMVLKRAAELADSAKRCDRGMNFALIMVLLRLFAFPFMSAQVFETLMVNFHMKGALGVGQGLPPIQDGAKDWVILAATTFPVLYLLTIIFFLMMPEQVLRLIGRDDAQEQSFGLLTRVDEFAFGQLEQKQFDKSSSSTSEQI